MPKETYRLLASLRYMSGMCKVCVRYVCLPKKGPVLFIWQKRPWNETYGRACAWRIGLDIPVRERPVSLYGMGLSISVRETSLPAKQTDYRHTIHTGPNTPVKVFKKRPISLYGT
jgi:hypothetical protein